MFSAFSAACHCKKESFSLWQNNAWGMLLMTPHKQTVPCPDTPGNSGISSGYNLSTWRLQYPAGVKEHLFWAGIDKFTRFKVFSILPLNSLKINVIRPTYFVIIRHFGLYILFFVLFCPTYIFAVFPSFISVTSMI